MPYFAVAPGMETLLPLANETRTDSTSVWKRCAVPGIVEKELAFFFRIKVQRNAGQLEALARMSALFTGLLVDRRITLGWMALDDYGGRN